MDARPSSGPAVETGPEATQDQTWRALMGAALRGDRVAYEQLLRQIMPYVRARARRLCAHPADLEEIVQDCLLTVHRVRLTYDSRRPFKPWLAAIVERRSIDALRRRRRIGQLQAEQISSSEGFEARADTDEAPDAAVAREFDGAQAAARVALLLQRLPPRQREALEMLKVRQMSLAEASLTTGQTTSALKVNVHRGLKRLRELLTMPRKRTPEEDR